VAKLPLQEFNWQLTSIVYGEIRKQLIQGNASTNSEARMKPGEMSIIVQMNIQMNI